MIRAPRPTPSTLFAPARPIATSTAARPRRRASYLQANGEHRHQADPAQKDDIIYEVHVRGLTKTTRTYPPRTAAPIRAPR